MTNTWNNEEVGNLVVEFDTAAVEPDSFDVLPDGDYPVIVEKVDMKATKDGTGQRLNVQLKITDGAAKGRVVFDGINVSLPNSEKAQQIGRKQLASLLEAAGMRGARDLGALAHQEVIVRLKTQAADGQYEARNVVRGYKAIGAAIAPPPPSAPPAKAPPAFMAAKNGAAKPAAPPTLAK